ncbi:MAG: hypothetical protein U5K33_00460 [Halofilum sp. (in: g-proteobacteria)]|nr:hypothetical protein [Halofilum sp. (in: g-proteobacteria)]
MRLRRALGRIALLEETDGEALPAGTDFREARSVARPLVEADPKELDRRSRFQVLLVESRLCLERLPVGRLSRQLQAAIRALAGRVQRFQPGLHHAAPLGRRARQPLLVTRQLDHAGVASGRRPLLELRDQLVGPELLSERPGLGMQRVDQALQFVEDVAQARTIHRRLVIEAGQGGSLTIEFLDQLALGIAPGNGLQQFQHGLQGGMRVPHVLAGHVMVEAGEQLFDPQE